MPKAEFVQSSARTSWCKDNWTNTLLCKRQDITGITEESICICIIYKDCQKQAEFNISQPNRDHIYHQRFWNKQVYSSSAEDFPLVLLSLTTKPMFLEQRKLANSRMSWSAYCLNLPLHALPWEWCYRYYLVLILLNVLAEAYTICPYFKSLSKGL